ncbi:hypothetical protein FB451DRAFT_1434325 [Mycena latifolia]|nr:hypothetical protein FB451DRAFT_1434325 [Mycena latifolia]
MHVLSTPVFSLALTIALSILPGTVASKSTSPSTEQEPKAKCFARGEYCGVTHDSVKFTYHDCCEGLRCVAHDHIDRDVTDVDSTVARRSPQDYHVYGKSGSTSALLSPTTSHFKRMKKGECSSSNKDFLARLTPTAESVPYPNLRRLRISNFRAGSDNVLLAFIQARTGPDRRGAVPLQCLKAVYVQEREMEWDILPSLQPLIGEGLLERRAPRSVHRDSVVLTCGAELATAIPGAADETPWGSAEKWVVPFLPLPLDDSHMSQGPPVKPNTGCGATIHTRASSRGKKWIGSADAAGRTVVKLPSEYFTDEQRCQLSGGPRRDECGCATVGMGCCVCGNTLGVRKTLCRAHRKMVGAPHATSYTFLADAVSPPLPRRSKIPITIDRATSAPRTSTSRDPLNMADWLSQARDRQLEPSPTRSEVEQETDSMTGQIEASLEARRLRLGIEAVFGRARQSTDVMPDLIAANNAGAADAMSQGDIVARTRRHSSVSRRNTEELVGAETVLGGGSGLFGR